MNQDRLLTDAREELRGRGYGREAEGRSCSDPVLCSLVDRLVERIESLTGRSRNFEHLADEFTLKTGFDAPSIIHLQARTGYEVAQQCAWDRFLFDVLAAREEQQ